MQIKKLEFKKAARDTALHTAEAFGWFYEVWHFVDAGKYRAIKSPNKDLGAHSTMEAAEAACQADFDADVLTLVDTRPANVPSLKHPHASFANCLRHAFLTGAGYDSLEKKVTDEDQRRWCEYDPPRVGSFVTMEYALDVAGGSAPATVPVDHDGTPFELLPSDLRTHLGDFEKAVEIAVSVSNIDSNEESYWIKQRETIGRIKTQISEPPSPWSTDLSAAPEAVDVLTLAENGKMRVAYRMPGKIRRAFCSGMSARGGYVLHSPVKWRHLPES